MAAERSEGAAKGKSTSSSPSRSRALRAPSRVGLVGISCQDWPGSGRYRIPLSTSYPGRLTISPSGRNVGALTTAVRGGAFHLSRGLSSRPRATQAGGRDASKLDAALERARELVGEGLG